MKFCSKCGTQLSDDAVFCSGCGARMDATGTAPENIEAGTVQSGIQGNGTGGQDLKEVAGNVVTNLTNTVNQAINSEKGQEYLTSSSKLSNIGYAAAVLGAVSVFFPVVSLNILGGIGFSVMKLSQLAGILIIGISLYGAYGVNIRKYAITLASGQALFLLTIFGIVICYDKVSGKTASGMAGYDMGMYFMLLAGIVLILIAGFLSLAAKQVKPDVGGAINEIKAMESSTVEINGMSINVMVLTVIMLALVFLGGALSQ
ncbi:zinc-ribbon domain-containing protein [Anaerovibrio sp.]|uniref:zinc ribbon domain-containing protein n=1 Tax=Anaerovibrio sp. TaxID=1872532 RepID=UPI003F15C618